MLSTVKPLPEHEVSHGVVIQIAQPIAHVLRFALGILLPAGLYLRHRLAPCTNVLDGEVLCGEGLGVAERVAGEGVSEDATAEGMSGLVDI